MKSNLISGVLRQSIIISFEAIVQWHESQESTTTKTRKQDVKIKIRFWRFWKVLRFKTLPWRSDFSQKKSGSSWFNTWGRFQAKALTIATQPLNPWRFKAPIAQIWETKKSETSQQMPHLKNPFPYQTPKKNADVFRYNCDRLGPFRGCLIWTGTKERVALNITSPGKKRSQCTAQEPRWPHHAGRRRLKPVFWRTWSHDQDQGFLAYPCFLYMYIFIYIYKYNM